MSGNQHKPDPKQSEFLKNYLDPKSDSFSNAYQSAINAGYEHEYAKVILSKDLDWLSEGVRNEDMLRIAEDNLKEGMEINYNTGDKIDSSVMRNVLDVSKFVATTLGKRKYSSKGEDAADKLAENITGMKIIYDGTRVQNKEPKPAESS